MFAGLREFFGRLVGLVVILALGLFLWFGGMNWLLGFIPGAPRVGGAGRAPSTFGPAPRGELESRLAASGITVYSSAPAGGGRRVTLTWPHGDANRAPAALDRARRDKVIRAWRPTGPNNIDVRRHGGRQVYFADYMIE